MMWRRSFGQGSIRNHSKAGEGIDFEYSLPPEQRRTVRRSTVAEVLDHLPTQIARLYSACFLTGVLIRFQTSHLC